MSAIGQFKKEYSFKNLIADEYNSESISQQVWLNDGSFVAINENGLIHHNGYYSKSYSPNKNGKNTVLTKQIISLNKTDENEIWLSYIDTPLITKIEIPGFKFSHFEIPELIDEDSNMIAAVTRIKKDSNNQLWVCTWGAGLIRFYPGKENKQYIFKSENDKEGTGLYIKDIAVNKSTHFLVTFFKGGDPFNSFPLLFNPENEGTKRVDIPSLIKTNDDKEKNNIQVAAKIVHWVYEEKPGKYWLGTYSGPLLLDLNEKRVMRVPIEGEDSLRQNQVNTINYIARDGFIWATTINKGVLLIDMKKHKGQYLQSDPQKNKSIVSNRVTAISLDPQNNVWVANGTGHLSVYSSVFNGFEISYWNDFQLKYSNSSNQSIPVNQFYTHPSGEVYISSGSGLIQYQKNSNQPTFMYDVNEYSSDVKARIGAQHFKVINDSIIIQTGYKLYFIDRKNLNRLPKLITNRAISHLGFRHDPNVRKIYYFRNPNKLGPLIERFNEKSLEWDPIIRFPANLAISEAFSFQTAQGNWLISEENGRFILVNPSDSSYQLFSPTQKTSFFPDSTVRCALLQEKNEILIGTQFGLYRFNEKSFQYEKLNSSVGLREKEGVNALVEDNEGNIWIAVNSELILWNKNNHKYHRFGKNMGLNVANFLPSIGQKDKNGRLYFACMYGILSFHPKNVTWPSNKLDLFLSEIYVNDKKVKYSDKNISLSWNENNLKLGLFTNQLFQIEPHHFEYRLKNKSKSWIPNGSSNQIRINNLPYGNYTLEVRAVNAFGIKSPVISFSLTIDKPFWLKWWFYLILIALLALGVYLIVQGRVKQLKKRSLVLQNLVKERTSALEAQKIEAEKQKDEAEFQKNLVEEKQKEITDSITYAKRIQDAILPSNEEFHSKLKDSFVLYLPKDIVAGDFYWLEPLKNNEVIFAAADCTGHGVPGAMVSVICNNALNRSVREFGLVEPGQILDKAKMLVLDEFKDNSSTEQTTIKDGMDIALCKLNKNTGKLSFAGAHNPLWIIRNGELIEIKANKQPVGEFENALPFKNHEIQTQKEDMIYIFSDGYADQFGGGKGKKFKSSSLKKLLLDIHLLSVEKQKEKLQETFHSWKGDYEQLDDVCFIGLRI